MKPDTLWQAFSPEKNTTGAMTCTFIKAVRAAVANKRKISYREILVQMHESLKRDDRVGHGCTGAGLRRVLTRKILQVLPIFPSRINKTKKCHLLFRTL